MGRSAYLVRIGASRVLVDCGVAVGRTELSEMVPDLQSIGRLDAVVLTHAHVDHIGWLPALVRKQESTLPIYCSEDTAKIVPIMLEDTRDHYERFLADRQRIAEHDPTAERIDEEYTRDDLLDVETRFRSVRFSEPVPIPHTDVQVTIFPAGHILGASSVLLAGRNRKVLLSGDISTDPQLTVGAASPPSTLDELDLLALESTYGDQSRPSANDSRKELVDFVRQTTRRGTAILPCFALGRAQEVLKILLAARAGGELPGSVQILVDGLARRINPIYVDRSKLDPSGYEEIASADRRLEIDSCRHPDRHAVVITTSGMLTGGPVIAWAEGLLHDPRHRLALLGYQDEGSPGGIIRQLQRQGRPPYAVDVGSAAEGKSKLRIASPVPSIGISAHADQAGLISFFERFRARHVTLVHGEAGAQAVLADKLRRLRPHATVHHPGAETLVVP